MATVKYDTKTGKRLKSGQSTTINGVSVKAGSEFNPNIGNSSANIVGGVSGRFADMTQEQATQADKVYQKSFGRGTNPDNLTASEYQSYLKSSSPIVGTKVGSTNASNVPSSSVVNTNILNTSPANQKLTFGEEPVADYSKYIPPLIETPVTDATKEKDTALEDYLKTLSREAPNTEDAYAKAQRETDILNKQKIVGDLTGQLNAIVNKGQAQQLSLIGQGRGIPTAILGGQSAEIARQTAIESLPVSAQLSAAQGALDMAESNLETLYQIYSKDAEREYEIKKEQKKIVYDIATEKEKKVLEKLDKQEERDYEEKKIVLKDIKDIATQAMQNQAPASVLSNIFKAKSYQEAVNAAGKYGGDYLQRELLLQQIANVKSQIVERNATTNSYGTITGKPQTAAQASANGYANRVAESDVIISNIGKQFTGKLAIGGALPNFLQGNDRQMYEQAKRNFITAVLRRESGAAIADSEFITAEKQYFPQAGDQPGVLAQKEVSRNTVINNLYRESGVNRPVLPGQIIESNGQRFRVGMDGETLDLIQ